MTATFGFCKRGLVLYPGCTYAGEVIILPMGITEKSFLNREPELFCYTEDVEKLMPVRRADGNKGTFGKVLMIAGSFKMAGAAVLAAKAAYSSGAGMVKVISCMENREIIQGAVPEALFGAYEDLTEGLKWADVICIGPGLGRDERALNALESVLSLQWDAPLIIDADGLNLLAEHKELQETVITLGAGGRSIILTPHVGELSRLTGVGIAELKENLHDYAKALAIKFHGIVVAKDARTFICREQGSSCVNLRGNSGMATAGSGDVLAGIMAGLLGQVQKDAFYGACVGVYLHAKAGDALAGEVGEYGLMAGDISAKLAELLHN